MELNTRFWSRDPKKKTLSPDAQKTLAIQNKKEVLDLLEEKRSKNDSFPKINMLIAHAEGMPPITEPRWGVIVRKNDEFLKSAVIATPFELVVGKMVHIEKMEGGVEEIPDFNTLQPLPLEYYTNLRTKAIAVISSKV